MQVMKGMIVLASLAMTQMTLAQTVTADGSALDGAMGRDPDRFAARITDLIAGFGGPEGLTAAGIEEHILLERAAARASALRRMLAMDLDADGMLDGAELAVTQRAASASGRGRLDRQFRAADLDGDGRVDAEELAADARAAGLRALSEEEAAMLRALLTLDRDGNSALSVDEIEAAAALASEAG
jgi:Ca2+-binding EF-hand superfamily protein